MERRHTSALLIAAALAWAGSPPAVAQSPDTTALPSRVSFQAEALRHRNEAQLPASLAGKDEPRVLWLARLAAEGRRPLRLAWRPAAENDPATADPFARLSLDVKGTPTLLPLYVAEPERWTRVMESLATASTCPCAAWGVSPGRVPDGDVVLGSMLRVGKSGGDVVLSWGSSCSAAANDYTVHEGTLGSWYSHQARACTTNGVTSVTLTPGTGSSYFLAVPVSDNAEGSYGSNSAGQERPKSAASCRGTWLAEHCP